MWAKLLCMMGRHRWVRTGEAVTVGVNKTRLRWACERRCGERPRWMPEEWLPSDERSRRRFAR